MFAYAFTAEADAGARPRVFERKVQSIDDPFFPPLPPLPPSRSVPKVGEPSE